MKTSEKFALNEWLSDYPENLTFDEVIDLIYEEDESITPWQTIEHYPRHEIAGFIESTRCHFEAVTADAFKALEAIK